MPDDFSKLDFVVKFDVDEKFNPSEYSLNTPIAILYVEQQYADTVIQSASKVRKDLGLPPTQPYKNADRNDDVYYPDRTPEQNFILKDGNSSK